MPGQDIGEQQTLIGPQVDKKDMPSLIEHVLKTTEPGVGQLEAQETRFPGTKPQHHHREKNKRNPAKLTREAGCGRNHQYRCTTENPTQGSYQAFANHIGTHQAAYLMQPVVRHFIIKIAQHMNLRRHNALLFELRFQSLKILKVVAGKKMSFHGDSPDGIGPQTNTNPSRCGGIAGQPLSFDPRLTRFSLIG